jgi:hypothetical protein
MMRKHHDKISLGFSLKRCKEIGFLWMIVSICLIPSFSLAGVNEAYQHLDTIFDKYHNTFNVYTNINEGGNHFYPTGWMGDYSSLSMNENWVTNCHSSPSCIKITFNATNNNWVAVYWQNPENNWGTTPNAGYDLRGATQLTFWARGETGHEYLEFFVGGIQGTYPDSLPKTSTGFFQLSTSWQQYSISLTSKDLSYVIGGFGFALNAPGNPGGATFYLDDIQYDKSRPNDLRFLVSYETLSSTVEPDKIITNMCFMYDNALALIAYLARGNQEDLRRAKILADAFVTAQNHDRYYIDGRLRNAYMSGDLLDHMTGKARLPGWWDTVTQTWYEDEFSVSTHTGNLAWTMIALLSYYEKAGGDQYLNAVKTLGNWIETNTRDSRGAGGYTGGYQGWEPSPQKLWWKSTEHNLDVYVVFMRLYQITGDQNWQNRAIYAKTFVEAMWNEAAGHFWTGTLEDGISINQQNIPLDIQLWAFMALNSYNQALTWAENHCHLIHHGFEGFDFNTDLDGVWFEGTAQMAVAYQINDEFNKSSFYTRELQRAQTSATNANNYGIVAACHDGVTTGFDWEYFSRLHVGATAWYIFAEMHYNPYWGTWTCGTPSAATLVAPSGTISSMTPTYTWNAVACATWYYLWVNNASGTPVIKKWYTAVQAGCASGIGTCSVTPAKTLTTGSHTWWIQTWNSYGYGPWSSGRSFTVSTPPPVAAPILPFGTIGDPTPSYIWTEVHEATWYYLWVNGPSGNVLKQWYTSAQAKCGGGACAVTPATTLANGTYTWWVQTWNSAGYGPWSTGKTFTVSGCKPGATVLISPSGSSTNPPPWYWWYDVGNATWYYLWVNGPSGTPVIQKWYTAVQANCNGKWCWVTNSTTLPTGTNTWWIQPWNSCGYGPWSAGKSFTISAAGRQAVGAVVIVRKQGTGTGTIRVGAQVCGPECTELTLPYTASARFTLQVMPATDSRFVGWQTAEGEIVEGSMFYAQPGDTVIAVFEKK